MIGQRIVVTQGYASTEALTQWNPSLVWHDPNPPITLESLRAIWRGPLLSRRERSQRPFDWDPPNLLLTTLSAAPPPAVPFVSVQWWSLDRLASAAVHSDQNLLSSTLAPVTTVWRGPLYSRTYRSEYQPEWHAPNLLSTTLAVTAAPFVSVDWPTPSKPQCSAPWLEPNLLGMPLLPPEAPFPFSQTSWPTITAPDQRGISWLANALLPTSIAPEAPFVVRDWPLPRTAPRKYATLIHRLSFGAAAPVGDPFFVTDWPASRSAPRKYAPLIHRLSFGAPAPPPAGPPFIPIEWPLARKRTADRLGYAYRCLAIAPIAPALLSGRVTIQAQFRRIGRTDFTTWQNPLLTTMVVPQKPFVQRDWPRQVRGRERTDVVAWQNLVLTLLTVQPRPFVQRDWARSFPVRDRTDFPAWQNLALTVFAAAAKPFVQQEWPRQASTPDRTDFIAWQNLALTTFVVPTMPFVHGDWGIPAQGRPAREIESWQNPLWTVPSAAPFTPIDWPLVWPAPAPLQITPPNLLTHTLRRYLISGVTRDCGGAPLGGATVLLFRTADSMLIGSTVSDANGVYSFIVDEGGAGATEHFLVAYLEDAPDVAGTTRNDIVGTA